MNSINFRAWYPEKQKMYEVAKVDMWGDPDQATCDLAAIDEELFDIYLNEVEIMQYTGIKDKYGREICEGDIIQTYFSFSPGDAGVGPGRHHEAESDRVHREDVGEEGITLALFTQAGLVAAGTQVSNREKIIYLKQYIILDRKIDRMLADLERQRSRLGKLTPTLSDMPGGGGSIYKSADINIIDKIVDMEAEINRRIDRVIDLKREIEQLIDSLDDEREKLLMSYRYLDGMTFEWIASEMQYHWRSVHKIHVRALNKIQIGQ